jgi:epoxyqueuosine reductase QueG
MPDPRASIRDRALALGFDAVGFCRAELGPEARERLGAFLAAGQHGDMGWLAAHADRRGRCMRCLPAFPTEAFPDTGGAGLSGDRRVQPDKYLPCIEIMPTSR